ncbi:hypothetical protein BMS3Abin01_00289 [bacterium BMS3Abin01]|nr:hypothetical protein BMS3Abin01_00289 [bacterium BMS3Abin01]
MSPFNAEELERRNRDRHARRLRYLKRSLALNSYRIDSHRVASRIIHEAGLRQHRD